MVRAAPGIERWKAFWPLLLLALAVRIGLGSLVPPAAAPDDPVARLAALSAFCDGHHHSTGEPHRHHPPADAGEGVLLLADAALALALCPEPLPSSGVLFAVVALVWYFPPVRGPPARRASALYAQGPPHLT